MIMWLVRIGSNVLKAFQGKCMLEVIASTMSPYYIIPAYFLKVARGWKYLEGVPVNRCFTALLHWKILHFSSILSTFESIYRISRPCYPWAILQFQVIAISAWYEIAGDEIGPVVENYREGFFWTSIWKKLRNFQF